MTEPSALEWVAGLRAGGLSARELAEHYLPRMWAADERVHAVLACEPERVLAEADAADRRIAAGGDPAPLLGLPGHVKDSIEVAGLRYTGGSVARRDHVQPGHPRCGGAAMRAQVAGAEGVHHPQFVALLESFPEHPPSAADWFALQDRIFEFRSRVRRWVAGYDALVTPVARHPEHGRPPHGVDPADYLRYLAHNDTHLFSVAGLPALSVPAGFEHDLPIGVQVAAPAWREHVVLAVGALVERCLGGVAGYAAAGTA